MTLTAGAERKFKRKVKLLNKNVSNQAGVPFSICLQQNPLERLILPVLICLPVLQITMSFVHWLDIAFHLPYKNPPIKNIDAGISADVSANCSPKTMATTEITEPIINCFVTSFPSGVFIASLYAI